MVILFLMYEQRNIGRLGGIGINKACQCLLGVRGDSR
jgi:hypothetical protein